MDQGWWNQADNGVISLEGKIAQGQQVSLKSELQPKRAFKLQVAQTEVPNKMVWTGGLPLKLCTGLRTYQIEETESGARFTMWEDFVGPLSPLIVKSLPDFQESFDKFSLALKEASEAGG